MRSHTPVAWLLFICCLWSPVALRAEEPPQEYQLKLAFLVNFARFISWPESSFGDNRISLCVLGDNPFGSALPGVEGKRVGEHQLATRVIGKPGEAGGCHLLFVPEERLAEFQRQNGRFANTPLVTVSDAPGFVEMGGGIEFVVKDGKLGFVINNGGLKAREIKVGSSLLNLAAAVR